MTASSSTSTPTPTVPEPDPDSKPTPELAAETPATQPTPEVGEKEDTREEEDFATCWRQLLQELFSNNHLIYYSLKDDTPEYTDSVIRIEVKNDIQREEFDSRRKSIVEYWRNHFKLNLDDLEIIVNEQKTEKKVIINSEDKFNNMNEQNPELTDFIKILNFKIKD